MAKHSAGGSHRGSGRGNPDQGPGRHADHSRQPGNHVRIDKTPDQYYTPDNTRHADDSDMGNRSTLRPFLRDVKPQ